MNDYDETDCTNDVDVGIPDISVGDLLAWCVAALLVFTLWVYK